MFLRNRPLRRWRIRTWRGALVVARKSDVMRADDIDVEKAFADSQIASWTRDSGDTTRLQSLGLLLLED